MNRRRFLKYASSTAAIAAASALGLDYFLNKRTLTTATSSGSVEEVSSSKVRAVTERFQDFPVTWNGDQPIGVDPKDYRLSVDGDVLNPLQLTLQDLYAMSSIIESLEISCVEGWSALVVWEGISLSQLLNLAGVPDSRGSVKVESVTGYAARVSGSDLEESATMIALKANFAPLQIEHGYPARLVLPRKLGLEWVKQVGRITYTKP